MLKELLVVVCASCPTLLACTGGGGGGLDGSKALDTLTEAEVTAFCEYSESVTNSSDFVELLCYDNAFDGVQQGGDCETLFAQCIATAQPADLECGQNPTDPFPVCASLVTVAEMQICLADRIGILNDRGISCASSLEDLNAILNEFSNGPLPASCVPIDEKCPELVGG